MDRIKKHVPNLVTVTLVEGCQQRQRRHQAASLVRHPIIETGEVRQITRTPAVAAVECIKGQKDTPRSLASVCRRVGRAGRRQNQRRAGLFVALDL